MNYRVMTNGVTWKIQMRRGHSFLWWHWDEWKDMGIWPLPTLFLATTYGSFEVAQKRCDELNVIGDQTHEWRPVWPRSPQRPVTADEADRAGLSAVSLGRILERKK
jgi:hypothetical protein